MDNITLNDKIFMENENIKIYNQIEKKAKEYFKKFIETKIFINDGTLLKKIKEDMEYKNIIDINNYKPTPLKDGHVTLNLWVTSGHGYTISIVIKLCFSGGSYEDRTHYCIYIEHYVYIGNLANDILKNMYESEQQPYIDFEYQQKQINLFKEKSKELKTIRDTINYNLNEFIKYDLVT